MAPMCPSTNSVMKSKLFTTASGSDLHAGRSFSISFCANFIFCCLSPFGVQTSIKKGPFASFMSAPFGQMQVEEQAFCAERGQAPINSCHRIPRCDGLPVFTPGFFMRSSRAVACAISSAAALVKQRLISACVLAAAHS